MAFSGENIDRAASQEDSPEDVLKNYEKMIAADIRRIEEEGGEDADHLKASLYEKWVPELLDTISMLCKTTSELEQVSTHAVIQLDHKLQETASATRAFMHRSADMVQFQQLYQDNLPSADAEGNSLLPVQAQLAETQQALEQCRGRCCELERTIDRLQSESRQIQDKLAKRERQLDDLLRNQQDSQPPAYQNEETIRLKVQLAEKEAELQRAVAQKRLFEKRACDREDKIKALTMEVAGKHDAALQLEERLKQAQQRDDKHQMQLNYQSMLLDALRKEVKKYKREKPGSPDDKPRKDHQRPASVSSDGSENESRTASSADQESCQTNSVDKHKTKEFVRLERRLEELEMMLRAKDEMISRMSTDAAPSRSQVRTVAIHQMSPEELKTSLLSKEKEIDEQRVLIGQLQEALVASKLKLEELQRSGEGATSTDDKDEKIRSLQLDLTEMEAQYVDCFSEVCKQNQQLILLREANKQYQDKTTTLYKELQQRTNSKPEQETAKTGNQLADVECELAFAKAQLSIYKTRNSELQDEVCKMKTTKSTTEEQLEKILLQKDANISEKNLLISTLQKQLSETTDLSTAEQLLSLQTCIFDGGKLLTDKNIQITLLQEKLGEICDEAEEQLKMLSQRDVALAKFVVNLDRVSEERDTLLCKIESLESQQASESPSKSSAPVHGWSQTETLNEPRRSRENSCEKHTRIALEEEISELKNQLKISKDQLQAWKQRYEIINTNLLAKEKKIEDLRCKLEEEKCNTQKHQTETLKLQETENQVAELRTQLAESQRQLSDLRNNCHAKEKTIAALRTELDEEYHKAKEEKIKDEERIKQAEEEVNELNQEMMELKSRFETKEQQLEVMYKEKEIEMQRLLSISCENVEGLQQVNSELLKKLENSEESVIKLNEELEMTKTIKSEKLEELALTRKELENFTSQTTSLQDQLRSAEAEVAETKEQLNKFEGELVLSTERILQLQAFLSQAQQDKQSLTSQLAEVQSQMSSQALVQQQQLAEMSSRLQSAAVEKEHLERSQRRLEEMCKSLTAQVGGQRCERDRAVRGLRQAAAERSRLCQEARQVLSVARQWLAEHRASTLELQQLRSDRERLIKENTALRHRRGNSTSILNPWDCGLVDREESGFWSSHWTTQLEEVDQELQGLRLRDEEWEGEEGGCQRDTGYQSGSSK